MFVTCQNASEISRCDDDHIVCSSLSCPLAQSNGLASTPGASPDNDRHIGKSGVVQSLSSSLDQSCPIREGQVYTLAHGTSEERLDPGLRKEHYMFLESGDVCTWSHQGVSESGPDGARNSPRSCSSFSKKKVGSGAYIPGTNGRDSVMVVISPETMTTKDDGGVFKLVMRAKGQGPTSHNSPARWIMLSTARRTANTRIGSQLAVSWLWLLLVGACRSLRSHRGKHWPRN